jgi:hypothetical protein
MIYRDWNIMTHIDDEGHESVEVEGLLHELKEEGDGLDLGQVRRRLVHKHLKRTHNSTYTA